MANNERLIIDKLKILFEDPDIREKIALITADANNVLYEGRSISEILGLPERYSIDSSKSILEQINDLYTLLTSGAIYWQEISDNNL